MAGARAVRRRNVALPPVHFDHAMKDEAVNGRFSGQTV